MEKNCVGNDQPDCGSTIDFRGCDYKTAGQKVSRRPLKSTCGPPATKPSPVRSSNSGRPLPSSSSGGRVHPLVRPSTSDEMVLSARPRVFATELQAADLGLLRPIVNKGVARDYDQRVAARRGKIAHFGLTELWRQANLQAGKPNPASAAGGGEHRLRLARWCRVEIKSLRSVFAGQIVHVAIFENRR
jgi:hypothetical protein